MEQLITSKGDWPEWIKRGGARPYMVLDIAHVRLKVNARSWYVGKPSPWVAYDVTWPSIKGECIGLEDGMEQAIACLSSSSMNRLYLSWRELQIYMSGMAAQPIPLVVSSKGF